MITVGLIAYDVFAVCLSYFLALWLRFDCSFTQIPQHYMNTYSSFIGTYALFTVLVFWSVRLYRSIWRFASYTELLRLVIATMVTFVFHCAGITLIFEPMPFSYYVFGIVFQFFLTLGVRFSYRYVLMERTRIRADREKSSKKRVLLIGAGDAGRIILHDIRTGKSGEDEEVVALIDDNPNKWNRYLDGVRVIGGRDVILKAVQQFDIDKIYMALPSADSSDKRDILNICKETSCDLKVLPGVYQLLSGDVSVSKLKEVEIEDLLEREPIRINMDEIRDYVHGKRVLISGGSGTIGSELARQVAFYGPKQLVIFEMNENTTYVLERELRKKFPELDLVTLIGSIQDSRRLRRIFEKYKPEIVYHAAAHKHVPLMEDSPCEAIKNNVIGTYKLAYEAARNRCQRFVMISTDKAVNPTNIMGASKRLCEMVIQTFDRLIKEGHPEKLEELYTHAGETETHKLPKDTKTEFVAVRFGNVLGSSGSVVPLFKKQIANGGPVTVTHPDIIRYFMTIPEAVSLVLQAGTYAKGGEIFVLDMGEPVKIDTLARNMIKLSGLKPDEDIKISYMGLRPGEKLYEEKLMSEEGLQKTPNNLIYVGLPIAIDNDVFLSQIKSLMINAYSNMSEIKTLVQEILPTYHPSQQTRNL